MLWDDTMQQSQDILGDKGSGALIRHENRNIHLNNGSRRKHTSPSIRPEMRPRPTG